MEKANSDKLQAEKDLEVAEKVLTLAKTLDQNANDIETINRAVNPGSYSNQNTSSPPVVTNNSNTIASKEKSAGDTKQPDSAKDIETLKETFKTPDVT